MIVSYPFFSSFILVPIPLSILGSVTLAIFAGLMNPKQKWVMILNLIVSVGALTIFQYSAVYSYLNLKPREDMMVAFFWINQALALLFFFCAYFSTKTLRGALLDKNRKILS
jgi:hypothetical protein